MFAFRSWVCFYFSFFFVFLLSFSKTLFIFYFLHFSFCWCKKICRGCAQMLLVKCKIQSVFLYIFAWFHCIFFCFRFGSVIVIKFILLTENGTSLQNRIMCYYIYLYCEIVNRKHFERSEYLFFSLNNESINVNIYFHLKNRMETKKEWKRDEEK